MTSGIYCIENKTDAKKYIGSSVDIEDRFRHHKSALRNSRHSNKHLQRAWDKHNEENFNFYIIEDNIVDLDDLEIKEDYYIEKYNTTNEDFGYNQKWGFGRKKKGTERDKKPMLETVKEKLSKSLSGRPKSEEWKNKVRKPKTDVWKRKIGDSHLYKKLNIETSSSYVGVYLNKKLNKWAASITFEGKKIYLGVFITEIEAAVRFDKEYCKLYNVKFGINFPNGYKKEDF